MPAVRNNSFGFAVSFHYWNQMARNQILALCLKILKARGPPQLITTRWLSFARHCSSPSPLSPALYEDARLSLNLLICAISSIRLESCSSYTIATLCFWTENHPVLSAYLSFWGSGPVHAGSVLGCEPSWEGPDVWVFEKAPKQMHFHLGPLGPGLPVTGPHSGVVAIPSPA